MQKILIASVAAALAAAPVLAASAVGASAAPRCQDVLRYLNADIEDLQHTLRGRSGAAATIREKGIVLRWGATPPRVLYMAPEPSADRSPRNAAERTMKKLGVGWGVDRGLGPGVNPGEAAILEAVKSDTEFVVWLINKELPQDWQLRTAPAYSGRLERGVIKILYLPHKHWPASIARTGARALYQYTKHGEIDTAVVLLDPEHVGEERHRVHFLLHEMLHALGRSHADRREFPETVMHPKAYRGDGMGYLKGLDKAALRAVYSPLVPAGTKGDSLHCDSHGRVRGGQ